VNKPGGEIARGEQASGRTSQGRKSQGANKPGGEPAEAKKPDTFLAE